MFCAALISTWTCLFQVADFCFALTGSDCVFAPSSSSTAFISLTAILKTDHVIQHDRHFIANVQPGRELAVPTNRATSCYIISADGPSARSRSLPLGTRFEPFVFLSALLYLMVYRMVPFFIMRKSLFGAVMLWATDFLPFLKKVSGVQTLVTIRLLSRKISIGPSYINLRSTHVCRKNTSIVYSWMRGVGGGLNVGQRNNTRVVKVLENNLPLKDDLRTTTDFKQLHFEQQQPENNDNSK